LGGVIQDEFGFMAAFLLPLLGISLVARATRREEEAGRLELLLGGRIARRDPTLAALLVATATIAATVVLFAVGLAVFGVTLAGSVLYSLSLGALAFVFVGLAALLAQLTRHSRGVYSWSLIVLATSYVLRGVGDLTRTWLTWLSPLGWAEKAAPFGDQRWWALMIPLAVGLALSAAALRLASRRDLGSAFIRDSAGPGRSERLRHPIGLAAWIHGPATLGWLAGAVLLTGMMGALSHQLLDMVSGNPAIANAMGIATGRPLDGFVGATQLYLALIAMGYVVQAITTLRAEEAEGRLEVRLSGTMSRARLLTSHALVVLSGLLVIVLGSSLVLALATALSVGHPAELTPILESGLAYLPAELVIGGLALALYGLRPQLMGAAWAAYAAITFIAFLGPGLKFAQWILDLAPTTRVGNPPAGAVQSNTLAITAAIAATLTAVAFAAFHRRSVPQG
ncbi:MAG: ABC transporter permease, partial [Propionicimonas sp.]